MAMVLDVKGVNRGLQHRLANLQQQQASKINLGTAHKYFSRMSFGGQMISRLDGSAKCGGCGK
uniref:Uncharacterized protein n=1 Tax=viral metagenome TaxID=1070528 RepID=A0A6C0F2X3_9ZZZZ